MKTTVYNEIEYPELDELVNKHFPLVKFEFVAVEEMSNDSEKSFPNIKKEDYSKWNKYDKKDFKTYIEGFAYPMWRTRLFLEYFVAHDILPEGNYLITVCW